MASDLVKKENGELSAAEQAELVKLKDSIDINSSNAILSYGAAVQRKSAEFISSVLENTKTKDLGEAGNLLGDLMVNLKKFDAGASSKGNFVTNFFSSAKSRLAKLQNSYRNAETNIDKIVDELERHRMILMQNVAMLDKLYDKNLEYANDLRLYIAGGEAKLAELRETYLPALRQEAGMSDDHLTAQRYKDATDAENRLEKKVHDLKLTRTVTLQSLPQIRLQQSSNNVLVDKIHSSIVNSIPLWKGQMVIALGLAQTANALRAQKAVTDTTNELLRKNSEMLKTATVETARESERAIVDIDVIKKANSDIIASIQQVMTIQEEGRKKRRESEEEIKRLELEMKERLINAVTNK